MTAAAALSSGPLPVGARLLVEDDTSASLEAEGISIALYQDQDTGEWSAVRRRIRCDAIAHGETAQAALAGLGSVTALILHPLVPREELDEARRALRRAHYMAARDIGDALDDGIEAAVWALAEVRADDARTLRGRIFAVAARALEPDAQALLIAVRRLAKGVA